VLTLLVEKSLVTLQPDGQRYRLLDTVQQYAQELLDAAGGGDEARSRHLAWCVTLAEQATSNLFGPDQAAWLRRLDLERQNLLSAHAWCDRAGDGAALGLRLGSALKHYWLNRGLLTLGHQVAMEALARAGAQGRTVARCRGLLNAGQLCLFMGRYEDAQRLLSESLGIAREIDDAERVTAALQPLGTAFLGLGDYPSARAYLEEALALAHARGSKRSVAAGLNALGQLNRMEGRLETAERLYAQMLVLARELREPEATAIGLLNLAMVEVGRGARDRVRDLLLEVFEIVAETGSKPAGQSALEVSAGMAVMQSDYRRAARLYGVAEAQTLQTGFHRDPADEAFLIPLVAKARAALGPETFAVEEKGGSALAYDDAIAEARAALDEQP
jgi:tetratricopeptide (TPR) repeat protein